MSRLSDQVTSRLRDDIISGRFPPGTRLTEAWLCRVYEVSRVPVREALKSLGVEGFVTYRAYAGVTVATTTRDDAEDLFGVRKSIERATVRRCAKRFCQNDDAETAPFAERLGDLVDEGAALAESGDVERLAHMNTDFHLSLAEFSRSINMQSLLRQVASKIEWLYALDVRTRAEHSWAEHRQIAEAVVAGDVELAGDRITQHIQNSLEGYQTRHGDDAL